ncbi:uncharacterized protein LOC110887715 [Helianthus annuus]|uniref:uncharacterized protein LOC110887715 n=1 Tax=Helianthus annuus TaxID=4232 RepID=UPI000B8F9FD8|nr:uncharacterized protein LOC110887715 [Helianthus annuus]
MEQRYRGYIALAKEMSATDGSCDVRVVVDKLMPYKRKTSGGRRRYKALCMKYIYLLERSDSEEHDPFQGVYGGVWPSILKSDLFGCNNTVNVQKLIKCIVGDGSSIWFWFDAWVANVTLQSLYPALFQLETNKHCTVKDHIPTTPKTTRLTWVWSYELVSADERMNFGIVATGCLGSTSLVGA